MTPGDLKRMLAPIRLPTEFAEFGPQDAFAAFLMGLLVAMALRWVLRPFLVLRENRAATVGRRILALAGLPAQERIFGLAALLRELDPNRECPRPDGLDAALYDPRGAMDLALLERAVLDAARKSGQRK